MTDEAKIRAHDSGLKATEKALMAARRELGLASNLLWGVYFAAYNREDGDQLLALRGQVQAISQQVGDVFKDVQQHGMTEADVAERPS